MSEQPYAPPSTPSPAAVSAEHHRTARRVALGLVLAQALLLVLGLVFRAVVYPRLGVAPGDAYGVGDVLELALAAALVLASLTALAAACVLAAVRALRDGRAIVALVVSGLGTWPLAVALRFLL